jgi:hypothetical protein
LNRYTYCRNNPINYIDPTGYGWFKKFFGKIFGAIAAVVGTILSGGNIMVGFQCFNFFNSLGNAVNTGNWGGFAGGLAGGILGGIAGGAWAGSLVKSFGSTSFRFGQGFLIGAAEMGPAGFGAGFGGALGSGESFGEAMQAGAISGGISAGIGGLVEGSYLSGMQNIAHGMSAAEVGGLAGAQKPVADLLNRYPGLRADIGALPKIELSKLAVFRHYGYGDEAALFAPGLRPGSYGTTDVYTSGKVAQQMLALPVHRPGDAAPNAFYNVIVDLTKTTVVGPRPVVGKTVFHPVYAPSGVPRTGGGTEVQFPGGTPPFSVVYGGPLDN